MGQPNLVVRGCYEAVIEFVSIVDLAIDIL